MAIVISNVADFYFTTKLRYILVRNGSQETFRMAHRLPHQRHARWGFFMNRANAIAAMMIIAKKIAAMIKL